MNKNTQKALSGASILDTSELNLNNINNKFGVCCGCPALVSDDRLFNNYVSSRIKNDNFKKSLYLTNTHSHRLILQTNGQNLINDEIKRIEKSRCTTNKKNKFYIDSSKYNFNDQLEGDIYIRTGYVRKH